MRPSNLNPAKFASLFRKEFELCKVTAGETVVVCPTSRPGEAM